MLEEIETDAAPKQRRSEESGRFERGSEEPDADTAKRKEGFERMCRAGQFGQVPLACDFPVSVMSDTINRTFHVMVKRRDTKTNRITVGAKTVAAITGRSERTTRDHIKTLVGGLFLSVKVKRCGRLPPVYALGPRVLSRMGDKVVSRWLGEPTYDEREVESRPEVQTAGRKGKVRPEVQTAGRKKGESGSTGSHRVVRPEVQTADTHRDIVKTTEAEPPPTPENTPLDNVGNSPAGAELEPDRPDPRRTDNGRFLEEGESQRRERVRSILAAEGFPLGESLPPPAPAPAPPAPRPTPKAPRRPKEPKAGAAFDPEEILAMLEKEHKKDGLDFALTDGQRTALLAAMPNLAGALDARLRLAAGGRPLCFLIQALRSAAPPVELEAPGAPAAPQPQEPEPLAPPAAIAVEPEPPATPQPEPAAVEEPVGRGELDQPPPAPAAPPKPPSAPEPLETRPTPRSGMSDPEADAHIIGYQLEAPPAKREIPASLRLRLQRLLCAGYRVELDALVAAVLAEGVPLAYLADRIVPLEREMKGENHGW